MRVNGWLIPPAIPFNGSSWYSVAGIVTVKPSPEEVFRDVMEMMSSVSTRMDESGTYTLVADWE
jgi:hypothetical protein